MFYVYILYSEKFDVYYIGQTRDLDKRLLHHNSGLDNFTRKYMPWVLVLSIVKNSRSEALQLEKKLKNLSGFRLKIFISKNSQSK